MFQYAETAQPYPPNAQDHLWEYQTCTGCGSMPAVETVFRGHRGMIVFMQFLSRKGRFCRDCGLATFRDMTAQTLVLGWWGYVSFLVTPVTVLLNLVRSRKVAALTEPQPTVYSGARRPLDPGAPLLHRPMAIIGVGIGVTLIGLMIVLLTR